MNRSRRSTQSRRQKQRRAASGLQLNKPVSNANYKRPVNPYQPIEILTESQIQDIHLASLSLLENTGMRVLFDQGRQRLKKAGAQVDDESMMVKMDRGLLMDAVKQAPSTLKIIHRNEKRNNHIGGNEFMFSAVGGAPNVSDIKNGKRPGTMADFKNFLRLSQSFDVIHMVGGAPEPIDVDTRFRHLEVTQAIIELTDKFPFVFARGKDTIDDAFTIIKIANGLSDEQFTQGIYCNTVVNTNSPLQLDVPMTEGIIEFAKAGQLVIITPFTLSGAMAPVTLAGALVLQNAEALFGIALAQIVNPGAPVAYGGFTSNVDMRSGAPAFGTPEYTRAAFASGQLARFYNLPWRSSNVNASNAVDAQSAYESQMSLWGSIMGGANIIKHGAGWLEGGLTASYEKFIIDIEMLQMFMEVFEPINTNEANLGLTAINDVGPGGHFFGTDHTLKRYRTAFYDPLVSDWQNYGNWKKAGSQRAVQRANTLYQTVLNEYTPPPLDQARAEQIQEYVNKRTQQGGVKII